MSRSFHRNIASPTAVNGARVAAFATLVLAASAFIPAAPAAATSYERATYCLSSDSENDCGFTSLGQCQATASGVLAIDSESFLSPVGVTR